MAKYTVWVGTDTLLYLPVYALADLGVLARVAEAIMPGESVSIEILPSPTPGDVGAIKHMLHEANNSDSAKLHVAVCDPVAAVEADPEVRSAMLLGAFIKQPSFWVIGRSPQSGVKGVDHRHVFYNDSFETGHFIGRHLSEGADQEHRKTCAMGEEFRYLQMTERYPGEVRVLTADIFGLVSAQRNDPSIEVLDTLMRHADFQDFLTVGIVTHQKYAKINAPAVSLLLEAIRSACVLLRTAERPAAALIYQLLKHGRESAPALAIVGKNDEELEEISALIAKRLFKDGVYSDTLGVSFHEWKGAVEARALRKQRRIQYEGVFHRLYNPSLANEFTGTWLVRAFQDYGRFVKGVRLLKYGSGFALGSALFSHIVIYILYNSATAASPATTRLKAAVLTSLLFASLATLWVSYIFLRDRVTLFWRFRRWFWNMSPAVVAALTVFLLGVSLALVGVFTPLDLSSGDVVLAVVPALVPALIWVMRQLRHA